MEVNKYINDVKDGKVSVIKTVKDILKEANKINKDYNYFNNISEELALELADNVNLDGKLAGLPISIKDCICVRDVESTAGSKILNGYKPLFNATVIDKLIKEGAVIIGKTSQDEFGFGSFNVNVGLDKKIPKNPLDKERVTGGSSGGSAGFTRLTKHPHVSISESTGGSIACPASFCGVAGLTPTYGLVSRYGLIDYANSLDKIGVMGKNVSDTKLVLDVIPGHDEKDSTSLKEKVKEDSKVKKVGIIEESLNVEDKIKDKIYEYLDSNNINYVKIKLPLTNKFSLDSYYIIAMAEASTNLAKLSGMRYGVEEDVEGKNFNEYFTKIRSENFGKEAKRRIILGTFTRMAGYRDAYYLKAMKVRRLIIEEYKKAFQKVDLLVSPTMPITAPKLTDVNKLKPIENYMMDILTAGPNLAGLPHLNVNVGYLHKMPIGLMFIADYLNENKLYNFENVI
ncbi:Asp-tRNA(Asn)/Glu-tRNA(Gln) amidotransferase GatCAB subunit A [archaeon]|nr:Asp-tRNA(Asn)/Glu-tRNA(Gln) amidotransferase GatCAB subunit A [archaeon]|tara:strand:+ start:734 stop:2098 length:1365 start_codon:yes stop_codon:yes gene_type:complete